MADVHRNYYQLRLLLPCGADGKEKSNSRNADDAKDHRLYLDDQYGFWLDWAIVSDKCYNTAPVIKFEEVLYDKYKLLLK